MTSSNRKTLFSLGIGMLVATCTINAAAQQAGQSPPAEDKSDGCNPTGSLLAFKGVFFGLTSAGGEDGAGTIFRIDRDGWSYALLRSFETGNYHWDGGTPLGSLIASEGVLYGTTASGGFDNLGTVFKIKPNGSGYELLHVFSRRSPDGARPEGSLTALGGIFYGTTLRGGKSNLGTIYKISADGSGFAVVHSFAGKPSDGSWPTNSLVAVDGILYGVTNQGGAYGHGTVFGVHPDGSGFTLLHSFTGRLPDDGNPWSSLIESGGVLYGMTRDGYDSSAGSLFRMNPDGSGFAILHSFAGADGAVPLHSLVAVGGVLYGTTAQGGRGLNCTTRGGQDVIACGTIFKINPDGSGFALLHSFGGGESDGAYPGSLIASDGVLYGMTNQGGAYGQGTLFRVRPDGSSFKLLHSFRCVSSKDSESRN